MGITNYDPKKVTVNVGGRIITGFGHCISQRGQGHTFGRSAGGCGIF